MNLVDKGIKYYEIYYEDLFEANIHMERKVEKCYDIYRFLANLPKYFDEEEY